MPSCLSSLRPSGSIVSILANDALSSGELFLYTALMILSTSYIRSLSLCSPSRYHLSTCRIFGVAIVPSPNSCYMNVLLTEAFQLLYPVLYKWRLSAPMIFFLQFRECFYVIFIVIFLATKVLDYLLSIPYPFHIYKEYLIQFKMKQILKDLLYPEYVNIALAIKRNAIKICIAILKYNVLFHILILHQGKCVRSSHEKCTQDFITF